MTPIKVKSLHELRTYLNGNNEQPTTCPECGSRTDFIEIAQDKQQHRCLSCSFEFFLDLEEWIEDDEWETDTMWELEQEARRVDRFTKNNFNPLQ